MAHDIYETDDILIRYQNSGAIRPELASIKALYGGPWSAFQPKFVDFAERVELYVDLLDDESGHTLQIRYSAMVCNESFVSASLSSSPTAMRGDAVAAGLGMVFPKDWLIVREWNADAIRTIFARLISRCRADTTIQAFFLLNQTFSLIGDYAEAEEGVLRRANWRKA